MNREDARSLVYSVFSDALMVSLALLIIPLVIGEYLFDLTSTQNLLFSGLSWTIYGIFVAEFVLKVLVAQDRLYFFKTNKLYTATSLIIIFSPALETISELFAVTPALRAFKIVSIIKLSRLTKLAAVSGRIKISWRRINFKPYAIVSMVVMLGFSVSFFTPAPFLSATDQVLLLQFIGVVGTIYAIITGFMIANIWQKYSALINYIIRDTASLRVVYAMSLKLKEPKLVDSLRVKLLEYVNSIVEVYWKETKPLDSLAEGFESIFDCFDDFSPKDAKSTETFTNILDELRKASDYKAEIHALLTSKVPKILWTLLIVLSTTIVLGMYILPYENQILATLSITMISIAVGLIGLIISDMNDPFKFGFWSLDPEEYLNLQNHLAATKVYRGCC